MIGPVEAMILEAWGVGIRIEVGENEKNADLLVSLLRRAREIDARAQETLSFGELRRENEARCNESFYDVDSRSPTDWATALSEETGEVARICKRVRDGRYKVEECGKLMAYELADVIMYADLIAARFGLDLGWAVAAKFNHMSEKVGSVRRLPELGWYKDTPPVMAISEDVGGGEYPW